MLDKDLSFSDPASSQGELGVSMFIRLANAIELELELEVVADRLAALEVAGGLKSKEPSNSDVGRDFPSISSEEPSSFSAPVFFVSIQDAPSGTSSEDSSSPTA